MEKLLIVNNLKQSNDSKNFYNEISFEISKPSLVKIYDEGNGNLFEILSGKANYFSGNVFLLGKNLKDYQIKDKLSLFLDPEKLSSRMILKNYLQYIALLKSISKTEAEQRLTKLIRFLELEYFLSHSLKKLPLLQKYLVSLICSLIDEPQIILFKWNINKLDFESQKIFENFILKCKDNGITWIIKTNNNNNNFENLFFDQFIKIVNGAIEL
ncbi:hypothetical protein SSABA_v1c07670 [Spiroplasma sabaudiense Ar-1343]|uniref:ABC transporter ATP-binding protein n=1 Tax=Spiroplasma sabaudiense Ar-1343 TaxID=1276257 RepID=W6AKB5_9MOLU|nr:hypothetical protein [Spiroplasma sabaudiense]AHI54169.1 hypothetical protein SSABA_v1c07670 [Spiroplasma sabaudiense Ar-1343]